MADRVERLTNLVALLLETRQPLSLVEIGAELRGQYSDDEPARRAAFERDKAALRSIGVPIDTEVVSGGPYAGQTRYRIDRRKYELADLDLEPEELRALQVAIATVRTGDSLGEEALLKVGAGVPVDVDTGQRSPISAFMPSVPDLPALREAVAARARVEFGYRDRQRRLEPWGVLLRGGFWYVVGRDVDSDAQRTFRVDRISAGSVVVGEPAAFARPADFEPRDAFPSDPKQIGQAAGETIEARVWVDVQRAAAVAREVGDGRVVARHGDGAIEVMVPATNESAFRSWLFGLGTHAVVLAPAELRNGIVDWLGGIVGRDAAEEGRT